MTFMVSKVPSTTLIPAAYVVLLEAKSLTQRSLWYKEEIPESGALRYGLGSLTHCL